MIENSKEYEAKTLREIKKLMKQKSLTQKKLGTIIGEEPGMMSAILKGRVRLRIDHLYTISQALDLPIIALCCADRDRRLINRTFLNSDSNMKEICSELVKIVKFLEAKQLDDIILVRRLAEKFLI